MNGTTHVGENATGDSTENAVEVIVLQSWMGGS
jgi:hypothetical protein